MFIVRFKGIITCVGTINREKKTIAENVDSPHSDIGLSGGSLRDENNPLQSVLGRVENGVVATFNHSASIVDCGKQIINPTPRVLALG